MSALEEDWRDGLDDVDARLVDGYQSGFPLVERPFRAVADDLGTTERDAHERVSRLRDAGIFRRFGAVLNPPVIGSSTLAALRVPESRFEEVADVVNSYRQVNHNYRRDNPWNMWFVVTAGTRETRDRILADIEARTGLAVLDLPMLTDYYIDLEFPVVNTDRFARESAMETDVSATRVAEDARRDLTSLEADVLLAVQDGLPLTRTPYRDVADAVGADVTDVLATLRDLLDSNCIKRIGCVVNHLVTGFDANCMVVWDVPDDELDARGVAAGELPYVTLCYHRPRRPEQDWPYNLFTMVHGRDPEAVDAKVDELAAETLPFEHDRLPSTETLKQTGARYDDLLTR
ncbi:siroheme decarboxylase subunit beta [Halarchaeum sp. P4]|uniref:siroheme decarboxylase subunit beta n=1 Tax=Halarchaeum sp. P4 TaxID=3421639 RepID=UPI003EBA5142